MVMESLDMDLIENQSFNSFILLEIIVSMNLLISQLGSFVFCKCTRWISDIQRGFCYVLRVYKLILFPDL